MPAISYDAQSLLIGGRRVWLVGGTVSYARLPRGSWRDRLRAAKQAGLNCIDTPVFWGLHEPTQGEFDFTGELDVRHFLQVAGEEGLYCVLRVGPYVYGGSDNGGMPGWLNQVAGLVVREVNAPFRDACARYLNALLEQVVDLQVSSVEADRAAAETGSTDGHPIVMMQVEDRWFCDHPDQARGYLVELGRYLREHGCSVPVTECNNLWSQADGSIACWAGQEHLAGDLRQLRVVQPDAPRINSQYGPWPTGVWGRDGVPGATGDQTLRDLASMLAVGAQYNVCPFHYGTNLGWTGGRAVEPDAGYVTTAGVEGAPLSQGGGRGPVYSAVKRVSMFASQFGQVFSHLEPNHQHACVAVDQETGRFSVIHQRGAQGHVAFLIDPGGSKRPKGIEYVPLLLPNGVGVTVPVGVSGVAWVAFDVDLVGRAKLTYTNLCPWAFVDKRLLVLFGPAGADGLVNINGAPLRVKVPSGKTPVVCKHEKLTIAVLNTGQVDAAYLNGDTLVVGCAGIDVDDKPVPLKGWARAATVVPSGKHAALALQAKRLPPTPKVTGWQQAPALGLLGEDDVLFDSIDGPRSLEAMGHGLGYGWYRVGAVKAGDAKLLIPESGDRLHVYGDNKLLAVTGDGPGAVREPVAVRLPQEVLVLADNLGRFAEGWRVGEPKGVWGHFYDVEQVPLAEPEAAKVKAPDLFTQRGFFSYARTNVKGDAESWAWKVKPTGKQPLVVEIDRLAMRAVVMANGEPVGAYDPTQSAGAVRLVLHVGEQLKAGVNELRLVRFVESGVEVDDWAAVSRAKQFTVYKAAVNLTARAQWSFAPWVAPGEEQYRKLTRTSAGGPCWFRGGFRVSRTPAPLFVEPVGMSKGQIYLNGHNVGRYFVAAASGQEVPGQDRYYLPEAWLRVGKTNELVLFDEHGCSPGRARLVYDQDG